MPQRNKSPDIDLNGIIQAIGYVDAEEVIIKMKKIDYVNKHHKYAICYHEATAGDSRKYYYTRIPGGRKKMKGVTKERLIEKLYEYYLTEDIDYSFKNIFAMALDEKIRTEVDYSCQFGTSIL